MAEERNKSPEADESGLDWLLSDWVSQAPSGLNIGKLQKAALQSATPPRELAHKVMTTGGPVWLRRSTSSSALPIAHQQEAGPDDVVIVPQRSSARIVCGDGSDILLREETSLRLINNISSSGSYYLENGYLRARVIPTREKKEYPFHVTTPAGRVEVTGTDFDVSFDRERGMEVFVRRGSVNVFSVDEKKYDLARNHQLRIAGNHITRSRLNYLQARKKGGWADQHIITRKQTLMLLSAMILIFFGIYFFMLPPPPVGEFNRDKVALFSTAPEVNTTLPGGKFFEKGDKITLTISSDEYGDGEWRFAIRFVFSYENLGRDQDGNQVYEVTLEDFESKTELENYGFEMMRRSAGFSYIAKVGEDGKLFAETHDLMDPEVTKGIITGSLTYAPFGALPDRSLKPGDEWTSSYDLKADYSEHLFFRAEEKYRFVEWVEHRNRLIAKVTRKSEISYGGITIPYKVDKEFPSHTAIQTDTKGETTLYFDAETAELIGATREETRYDKYKLTKERTFPEAIHSDAEVKEYRGNRKRSLISVGYEPGMPH